MIHFVYRTTSLSGKFYIGRHSTLNVNDGYKGSGKWIRNLKDKSNLITEILEFANTTEELILLEESYIRKYIFNKNCMNFHLSGSGFLSGKENTGAIANQYKIKNGTFHLQSGEIQSRSGKNRSKNKTLGFQIAETLEKANSVRTKIVNEKIQDGTWILQDTELHRQTVKNQLKNGKHCSQIKKQCEYCNKIIDSANYSRSHGKNCFVFTGTKRTMKYKAREQKFCSKCGKTIDSSNFKRYNHGENCSN